MKKRPCLNQKGVALITALLMSAAIMALIVGTLYMVIQSTAMSGAGKRYATAAEAADGAINLGKDTINMTMWGSAPAAAFTVTNGTLAQTIIANDTPCTLSITLPGNVSGNYAATVTITRLYNIDIPGGRIEFARATGGTASRAIYFRITARVTGPNNSTAENAALYRFAG